MSAPTPFWHWRPFDASANPGATPERPGRVYGTIPPRPRPGTRRASLVRSPAFATPVPRRAGPCDDEPGLPPLRARPFGACAWLVGQQAGHRLDDMGNDRLGRLARHRRVRRHDPGDGGGAVRRRARRPPRSSPDGDHRRHHGQHRDRDHRRTRARGHDDGDDPARPRRRAGDDVRTGFSGAPGADPAARPPQRPLRRHRLQRHHFSGGHVFQWPPPETLVTEKPPGTTSSMRRSTGCGVSTCRATVTFCPIE